MIYGQIKGLDTPISRLVMGSMVCTTDNMDLTRELLDAFVAAGGNCIDSAHVYGGGKSERAVGQWMQERGNREQIVLVDKGAHPYWQEPRVDPENVGKDIAESLERVQTDYIDLYLLHRDNPDVPVGPIVECLNEHKAAGRIRAFGGSNWTTARLEAANAFATQIGLTPFAASSPNLSLATVNEVMWRGCLSTSAADRAWYEQHQFPLFSWSSQASGFFAGIFSPDDPEDAHKDITRVYYNEGNWKRLRRARELGEKKGATSHQIALAWVLNQPFPVFALIGPRTVKELNDSLPGLEIALTEEERRWLNLEN